MTKTITVIERKNALQFINLGELWRYRELLFTFVQRDFKLKYRQTVLGILWAILQPLTTMIVFSFFFGKLAKMPSDGVPYPIFSFSGLLLWTYFSNSLSSASNSMVGNAHLITKVYFPRVIVPIASTLYGLIDYAISMIIMVGLIIYYQIPLSPKLLLLPLVIFFTVLLSNGLGFILASINVKFRDVRYILPFFLQLLLYVTPVIYPASVAERFKIILYLNPMTGLIETHRAIWLMLPIPWMSLFFSIFLSLILLFIGALYFRQTERQFADII